ncbi:hypothetical protein B0E45_01320 [Sinorhizobium sp. A49]|nr:hypothetical protein B0E45_01320 [Sinorhizobium sp. A49]
MDITITKRAPKPSGPSFRLQRRASCQARKGCCRVLNCRMSLSINRVRSKEPCSGTLQNFTPMPTVN